MPFVIREHPTLLDRLNGVKFETHASGSISVEVDEVTAARFLLVPGYRIAEDQEVPGYVAPVEVLAAPAAKVATAAQKPARKTAAKAGASAATEGNDTEVTVAVTGGDKPAVTDELGDQTGSATGTDASAEEPDSDAASAADAPLF
jgi:hypothetical protein